MSKRIPNKSGEHLSQFDYIFGTNASSNIKNMPLASVFFEKFRNEFYSESEQIKELKEEQKEVLDKLKETFTEEQIELFNKYVKISDDINIDIERQLFLFGFICAAEFYLETIDKKLKKEN